MKKKEKRPLIVISSGMADEEFQSENDNNSLYEFNVQKTAETSNKYPAIAQGYPVSGFKDIKQENAK